MSRGPLQPYGLRPEEQRLWALVARTVRRAPHIPAPADPAPPAEAPAIARPPTSAPLTAAALTSAALTSAALTSAARRSRALAAPEAIAALALAGIGRDAKPAGRLHAAPSTFQPAPIEPNRRRRIVRAREPIGARLDLHGHDQDRARAALHAFIARARAEGMRAVLVITGKGRAGVPGVLKARVPHWLSEPPSREAVAGVSRAEQRHGGEGALYVALKRAD